MSYTSCSSATALGFLIITGYLVPLFFPYIISVVVSCPVRYATLCLAEYASKYVPSVVIHTSTYVHFGSQQ